MTDLFKRAFQKSASVRNILKPVGGKRVDSAEVQKVCSICVLYQSALSTLTQIRLQILTGQCQSLPVSCKHTLETNPGKFTMEYVLICLQVWHIWMTSCPSCGPLSVSSVLREASNFSWSVSTTTLKSPNSSWLCSCSSVTVHGTSSRNCSAFLMCCAEVTQCACSNGTFSQHTVDVLQNSGWHWSVWRADVFQNRGAPHYLLVPEHICVQNDMGWHLRWVWQHWTHNTQMFSALHVTEIVLCPISFCKYLCLIENAKGEKLELFHSVHGWLMVLYERDCRRKFTPDDHWLRK